uniref:Uncharacterized protein n=1 Tax=Octopus bimaculoides TaxID=37653 RepID=A0A0L8HRD1_OCTBM
MKKMNEKRKWSPHEVKCSFCFILDLLKKIFEQCSCCLRVKTSFLLVCLILATELNINVII